jgi:hypothetical protein
VLARATAIVGIFAGSIVGFFGGWRIATAEADCSTPQRDLANDRNLALIVLRRELAN